MKYDVIIIGAGAAGLMAMKEILKDGYKVCLLEASDIAGGRIATVREDGFEGPVEKGAEFIHGKAPLTFKLLKQAGIATEEAKGEMVSVQNGEWQKEEHDEHWGEFMKKLNGLKTDLTILQFLDENFPESKYIHLRQAVQGFAEGFDLADISKASILSIKNEWKNVEKTQYRIEGGYMRLINYLLNACRQSNGHIFFNCCVNKIEYNKNNVIVHTTNDMKFESSKLIITVSVGVLQSGTIQFAPALNEHAIAIQALGFGAVIKFLLQFENNFWKKNNDDIGFLLSDEDIPTWWTQSPANSNLLTGWVGGSRASEKVFETDSTLLETSFQSLSNIFKIPVESLKEKLVHYKIINWLNQPYAKGGYSYNTIESEKAKKILSKPINDIIFFAGEAFSEDDAGTVESALQSGFNTASMLIKQYKTEKQL